MDDGIIDTRFYFFSHGKQAHEAFQAEAKDKKQGRLSRLRAYLNNEKE